MSKKHYIQIDIDRLLGSFWILFMASLIAFVMRECSDVDPVLSVSVPDRVVQDPVSEFEFGQSYQLITVEVE